MNDGEQTPKPAPAESAAGDTLKAASLLARFSRELSVAVLLALVLAAPFLLKPKDNSAPSRYDKRLVIMTPHHELIRQEFGRGFAKHWKNETGQTLYIDWRVGGTAELTTLMRSDYSSAFQRYWTATKGQTWTDAVGSSLFKSKETSASRTAFLESNVGIGVDVFFGGGPYDFNLEAEMGVLVNKDLKTGAGLARMKEKNPGLFSETGVPEVMSGQKFRDKDLRWIGTCLSSFGVVYNRDVLGRLKIEQEPTQWEDLANPKLQGQVALADPTKSGSVMQAFEMIVQQEMRRAIAKLTENPGRLRTPEEIEAAGVRQGWQNGLQLIQKIAANARYFTDSSPKIPLEVSKGDAAAGMCIDFYGRSAEEDVRQPSGRSRVAFVAPIGGTTISVDAIGMMRGASEPELAEAFMTWVLSDAGQKLWSFRRGMPGGPASKSLRRLPVRRDFYTDEHRTFMADAAEDPWEKAKAFVYEPKWTGSAFSSLRFLIKVACVDTHHEMKKAWAAIVEAGMPVRALEVFGQMTTVNYDAALGDITAILKSNDKVREVREARRLNEAFRRQYEQAYNIAKAAGGRG
jgi:ABC-type Fe3+ transport system substrate-binding protein